MRTVNLAERKSNFTTAFCLVLSLSCMVLWPTLAVAEKVNIPLAKAMRAYQARYKYLTSGDTVHWDSCICGTPAPAFPSDNFYDTDLESRQRAVELVKRFYDIFWAQGLYYAFVREEYHNLEGQGQSFYEVTTLGLYRDTDLSCNTYRNTNTITVDTVEDAGKRIYEDLQKFKYMTCGAIGAERGFNAKGPIYYGGVVASGWGLTIPDARDGALWYYNWLEGISYAGPPMGIHLVTQLDPMSGDPPMYDGLIYFYGPHSLTKDLTAYPKSSVDIYLKLKPYDMEKLHDPPVNPDYSWHLHRSTDGGGWWTDGDSYPKQLVFKKSGIGEEGWEVLETVGIVTPKFEEGDNSSVKCQCECKCAAGTLKTGLDSLSVQVSLGRMADGKSAGYLYIHEDNATPELATPAKLHWAVNSGIAGANIVTDSTTGWLQQIIAPQCTIVVDNSSLGPYGYHIGVFDSNNNPTKIIEILNPDAGTASNKLTVTEKSPEGNTVAVHQFIYDGNGQWELIEGAGGGLKREVLSKTWTVPNVERQEVYTVAEPGGTVRYKERRTFHVYPWGEEMIEKVVDPDNATLTTSWTYYDNATTDGRSFGLLHSTTEPNGRTVTDSYTYDQDNVTASHTQSDGVKTTVITYDHLQLTGEGQSQDNTSDLVETTVETMQGAEVSRSYRIYWSGKTYADVWDIQCVNPGAAWDNTSNRVTKTEMDQASGKVKKVQRPDGTISLYSYSDYYGTVTTVKTGQPNSDGTDVDSGTQTVTTIDGYGNLLSTVTTDIPSGIATASETYTNDAQGRPTRVDSLDGYTTTGYTCCGVDNSTDKDGILTHYLYDELKRVTQEERAGVKTAYDYDAMGNILAEYRVDGQTRIPLKSYTYDLAGRQTAMITHNGTATYTTTYSEAFNGLNPVKTTANPDGSTLIEETDPYGRPVSVTGTAAHPVFYAYGVANGMPYTQEIKGTSANGTEWTKTFTDLAGRTAVVQYADGACAWSLYNDKGQLIEQVDPDNITTLYQYNGRGELEYTAIDMNGNGQIDFGGTDRITHTVSEVTSAHGTNVQRTTTEVYTTNGSDNKTTSVQEVSTNGTKSWSAVNGRITYAETTRYADNQTRTVKVTQPDGISETTTYVNGQLSQAIRKDAGNAQTGKTTYDYDAFGRVTVVTVQDGNASSPYLRTTSYGYNALDQVDNVTLSADNVTPQTTTYVYDAMGRQGEIHGPHGDNDTGVVYNEYWPTGEAKKSYGARTYPVSYTYDYAGRMATMTTYKEANGTTGEGSGGAAVTTWNYDPLRGWLTSKVYSDNHGPSYTYTPGGKLATRTWARGLVTTYGYNAAGDLSGVTYSDNATPSIGYTYDRCGRRTHITDAAGTHDLTYDDNTSQLDTETLSGNLYPSPVVLNNDYDNFSRRSGFQMTTRTTADLDGGGTVGLEDFAILQGHWALSPATGPEGDINGDQVVDLRDFGAWKRQQGRPDDVALSIAYGYDGASRMVSVARGTDNATYGYELNSSLITTVTSDNGSGTVLAVSKAYDHLNRLINITATPANGSAIGSSYGYNNANQRTDQTKADNTSWSYGYDNLGQITSAGKSASPACQFSYAYDNIGNRLTAGAVGALDNACFTYSPNALNQYTSIAKDNTSSDNLTYDLDGNLTGDGRWVYAYDGENRLVGMSSQTDNMTLLFTYDYLGRRVGKEVQGTGSYTIRFVYDGWNVVAELDSSNGLLRSYTWGLDLSGLLQGAGGIGGLAAVKDEATGHGYLAAHDGKGNVVGYIADNGTVGARFEYDPYGNTVSADCSLPATSKLPFRFSTKYTDAETGLVYFGYRFYNPDTGRWINRDPMGEEAGTNLYCFVSDNPVYTVDVLGLGEYRLAEGFNDLPTHHNQTWGPHGIFASIPPTEDDYKAWVAWRQKADMSSGIWPDAADGMFHYLGATGLSHVVNVDKYVRETKRGKEDFYQELNSAMAFVEDNSGSVVVRPYYVSERKWKLDMSGDLDNFNWRKTLHSYDRLGYGMIAEDNGCRFKMSFFYGVKNWYSFFHKTPEELWPLHVSGLAQEYEQFGEALKTVEWCKKQRFNVVTGKLEPNCCGGK